MHLLCIYLAKIGLIWVLKPNLNIEIKYNKRHKVLMVSKCIIKTKPAPSERWKVGGGRFLKTKAKIYFQMLFSTVIFNRIAPIQFFMKENLINFFLS